ncbi:MAG: hypothetical protein ACEPO2_13695 [Pelagibaca sp.]
MLEVFRIIILGICLVMPQAVFANIGTVRAGEHGDFTRLTIATELDIIEVRTEKLSTGRFGFSFSPDLEALDNSRLFDRINADRIKAVIATGTGLEIELNCDCEPQIMRDDPRLIIIDIQERPSLGTSRLPVLPIETGTFPPPLALTNIQSNLFALDHSVVDRVSKMIASQIVQTAHISGFSNTVAPSFRDLPNADAALTEYSFSEGRAVSRSRCALSDAVWSQIGDPSELPIEEGFDDAAALQTELIVRYLSEGQIEEARMAAKMRKDSRVQLREISEFEAMLSGRGDSGVLRFGDCNPLDDVFIAAMRHEVDVTKSIKIQLLKTFSALPIGLQIMIYPRLNWLIEASSEALFPKLSRHVEAELAMAERAPIESITKSSIQDPDSRAALSIELRGTDQEKDSWFASFASYLEHSRYFDALKSLSGKVPLTEAEHARAVTQLVDHLVSNADSVTFVQIALGTLPELTPPPSQTALAAVAERLVREGFIGEVSVINQLMVSGVADLPTRTNDPDVGLGPPEERASTSAGVQDPLPLRNADRWTVALARERVESAQALREAFAETLSR